MSKDGGAVGRLTQQFWQRVPQFRTGQTCVVTLNSNNDLDILYILFIL